MKLLSEIQNKAEERKRQVTTSQQATIFQVPEATQATAGQEYILTIPDTQPVSIPFVQLYQIATTLPATMIAKVQQPSWPALSSAQPASFLVVDDQQPVTSRQLMFTLREQSQLTRLLLDQDNMKTVNTTLLDYPASSVQSQVFSSISRSTHHNHFHPINFNQHHHQCHLPPIKKNQDSPASPASRVSPNSRLACIKSYQPTLLRATQSFQNNL